MATEQEAPSSSESPPEPLQDDAPPAPGPQGEEKVDLMDVLNALADRPCQVVDVELAASQSERAKPLRTREALIRRELEPLYEARTLEEVRCCIN